MFWFSIRVVLCVLFGFGWLEKMFCLCLHQPMFACSFNFLLSVRFLMVYYVTKMLSHVKTMGQKFYGKLHNTLVMMAWSKIGFPRLVSSCAMISIVLIWFTTSSSVSCEAHRIYFEVVVNFLQHFACELCIYVTTTATRFCMSLANIKIWYWSLHQCASKFTLCFITFWMNLDKFTMAKMTSPLMNRDWLSWTIH